MIQTSYFASKAPNDRKVCIAKWAPRYWHGPHASMFAPSYPRAALWREVYRHDLEERFPNAETLRAYLGEIEINTPDPILCCYESDPSRCHRRILAGYIKEKLGWDIPEWGSPAAAQLCLI